MRLQLQSRATRVSVSDFRETLFTRVRVVGTARLHGSRHLAEQIDDVVESYQVSILVVANLPVFLVSYLNAIWNRSGFSKINQPAAGMLSIVKEQQ